AYIMNRCIPNGTYGGVRGRGLITPSYSIVCVCYASLTKQSYVNFHVLMLTNPTIPSDISK
ncbi:hypothetical protein P4T20_02870, partial [Aneurinibacillus thermoaerophilus]|uniref:hypothetical protein n=1 Tax=Aneurinibacillus thermoaerophilus TaxID=143495 RepID=UPI002E220BFF|nr:hypothetical protein [Aneurinibacillus thermoaerophilus]